MKQRNHYYYYLPLLVFLLTAGSCHGGLFSRKKRSDDENETTASSKTTMSLRLQRNETITSPTTNSLRMKDQPAALPLEALPQSDITTVLLRQEAHGIEQETKRQLYSIAGLSLASIGSLLIVFTITATTSTPLLSFIDPHKLASLVALAPWMLVSELKQGFGALLLEVVALLELARIPAVQKYLSDTTLPWALKQLHRIIIMELWRTAWSSTVGKHVSLETLAVQLTPSKELQRIVDYCFHNYLPSWMQSSVQYVHDTLRRGCEKLFRKRIEKTIQGSIEAVVDYSLTTLLIK